MMLLRILQTIGVAVAVLLACALLAAGAVVLYARGGVTGLLARSLPQVGEPEVGVDYRADVDCQGQIYVGGAVWRLELGSGWPPPEEWPGLRAQFSPWEVPGIVRFVSPTAAVFRAQTNGSEWQVVATGEHSTNMCI